jgi:hypothetical protein
MRMYGRIEVEDCVRGRWNKVREDSIKENVGVKTHCYTRSGGLIQSKGSARVPKAVYD